MNKIRVLIADDSSLVRSLLAGFLADQPDIEVVGEAADGRRAVELALALRPDVMTMDLEMPVMSGLAAIEEIMHTKAVPILVVSSAADAQSAFEAVRLGALEVVSKPDYSPQAAADFVARVRMLAGVSVITRIRPRARVGTAETGDAVVATVPPTQAPPPALPTGDWPRVFALAASTGGPPALAQVLPRLPADFPCPVLIAQHIADGFAPGMAEWLASLCALPVRIPADGETLAAGTIYLSPSERHLTVAAHGCLRLRERGPTDLYRPSCDALLQSVAEAYDRRAVGIVFTGMGSDGARGLARIRERGGVTLAQDEASSVIFGMNRVAIEAGAAARVLPLAEIAGEMLRLAAGAGVRA